MDFFSILTLIGGLALFLYGMEVMGDGLKKLAGGRLEAILERLTSTKWRGFLLGLIVTAAIQSSSATTVMLVGFVNSGIMKFAQTISITIGANVGTTVTAWILSLTGITGDNFFLKILKPDSFSPILAAIGIVMYMFSKRDKDKDIGSIFVGFAVLMFGMETMSGSMEGLKSSPEFVSLLTTFKNPVACILVATIFTAIIQSSSASVGILQALALTGIVPYSLAIPVIFGQNIGTTITPVLSAISGNAASKRVAASCVYMKVITTVIVTVVFYVLDGIFNFPFMDEKITVFMIAVIHTLFNLLLTVMLMPFSKQIEKLAYWTVPLKEEEKTEKFSTLDDRFLEMPSFAIEKCRDLVCVMAERTKQAIEMSIELLDNYDKAKATEVYAIEKEIDKYEDKIGTYLVKVSSKQTTAKDGQMVTCLLHCVGDLERMSDHAANIVNVAHEINEKEIVFSEQATKDIKVIAKATLDILDKTVKSLVEHDLEMAQNVEPMEQVIDTLINGTKAGHIERLQKGQCTIELGFVLMDLLTNCERISDHCSNIAVAVIETDHGTFATHKYLKKVREKDDGSFKEKYDEYLKAYTE